MNLNELRVGNYVCTSYMKKSVFKVNAIHSDRLYFESIVENFKSDTIPIYVEPVKLTEEWLLKAKLTQTIQNTFLMGGFELIYDSPNERYNVHTFRGIICVVRYVHQLQNLYFALCGEELVFSTEP